MFVLIVEDEPTISRILERKLKKLSFEVKCVPTIQGAKQEINTRLPDLLFLDFVLEDGRATDLLSEPLLKKISHVIMMSAFMEELDKNEFSSLNILDFLIKPFEDIDAVLKKVEELGI